MKKNVLLILLFLVTVFACKKEKKASQNPVTEIPACKPVTFLSGKIWAADTLTINPPVTYNQLSADDKQSYQNALAWFRGNKLIFNNDCSTSNVAGDWDFGYYRWGLITTTHQDKIILFANGNKDTLRNWTADSLHLTYQKKFSPYTLTYIYK